MRPRCREALRNRTSTPEPIPLSAFSDRPGDRDRGLRSQNAFGKAIISHRLTTMETNQPASSQPLTASCMSIDATPAPDGAADPNLQLAGLRVEIDRIDAAMHGLLIDRSAIIDRLIDIKAAQGGGSAFRPGREAEMMRRLVERHRGHLPLDTVESIWRVIISTFTYLQSHYAVHADTGGDEAAMRDSARFHFGFTVPLRSHVDAGHVICGVAEAEGDLGLIRLGERPLSGAWWRALEPPEAPKVIARLPFVERPDHPAGIPVLVVARPVAAAAARDVVLWSLTLARNHDTLTPVLANLGGEIIAQAHETKGSAALVALPGSVAVDQLRLAISPTDLMRLAHVGSHAARFGIT